MSAGPPVARTTRTFTFSAGHRYEVRGWTADENRRVFGPLRVPHGHNYVLDVTIRGAIDERTGMVVDLTELKSIVTVAVVDRFDHADLNADPIFAGVVPTTENLAVAIWRLLAPKLGPDRLDRVRLWEDPTLSVEYWGP
jgi:6-pyruvoyltetrahydropterin/6-carboxytetrahydropterin synthase